MARITGYLLNMLPYMLSALPVVLVVRFFRCRTLRTRGLATGCAHEAGLVLFMLFLVGLLSQTALPKLEFGVGGPGIVPTSGGGSNLIPGRIFADCLRELSRGNWTWPLINLLGNLCIFLPVGLFPPLLWRGMTFRRCALLGFCCSLLIELLQLPQARMADIDDLWLNTLGAVLGFLLYALLRRCAPRFCAGFRLSAQKKNTP